VVTLSRRFLVVVLMMFWQGGFVFYSSVVVHSGDQVLGGPRKQGFVTRRVTNYLNLAGAVALLPLAWDTAAWCRRRRARWMLWGSLGVSLGVLAWLHVHLDAMLDPEGFQVLEPVRFYQWHRWYLLVSTAQWICASGFGILALCDWRDQDRAGGRAVSA
jgi:hypothetical protein